MDENRDEPFNPALTEDQPVEHDPAMAVEGQAMPEENKMRLAELRAKPVLTDDERAEFERLNAAESKAAGYVAPPKGEAPAVDPHVSLTAELVAMFEHAVEIVPALRALEPRLAAVRDRLYGILHPQKDGE